MSERFAHVVGFALSHPWNIDPPMLAVVAGILARHIAGVDSSSEIAAALANRKNLPQPRAGSVAILPIYGVLAPRMNQISEMSGGTTFEKLSQQLKAAMGDKSIKTVVLDIDSPGGSVAGNGEFAREVMAARTKKPIVAQIQYTGASAAYHIAAAATEIVAAPSARVGSIGTYTIHNDLSDALKQMGIKRTYISAGEGKVDGNETGPPSEEYLERSTADVTDAFNQFVGNVVKGRGAGMTPERVRKEWKAHVYGASQALALGMIDRIATLDETLARILSSSPDAEDQRAALTLSGDATDQEPATATSQERLAGAELERQIFELQLP